MLNQSQIYTFLDDKNNYAVHFLEGQKLVCDLITTHNIKGNSLHFFRNSLLAVQPIISFLKLTELIGVYIDSDAPFFRYKIEVASTGQTRTVLIPESFDNFPKKINGVCRIVKLSTKGKTPYTSVIELKDSTFEDVMNKIFSTTYQFECSIKLSSNSDQSIMIMKLPPIQGDEKSTAVLHPHEYWNLFNENFNDLFLKNLQNPSEIKSSFVGLGMKFLGTRNVEFSCSCSKERFIIGIKALEKKEQESLFSNDIIETKCDYCKKTYQITKSDLA